MEVSAQTAVVTGASRGIGRAIALELAARGARVAVNYLSAREAAEAVVARIAGLGGRAVAIQADVRDAEQAKRLVARATADLGEVGILVNNAGIVRDNLAAFMTPEEWRDVLDTCLTGAFYCAKAAGRSMARRHWGRIVNIASDAALLGDTLRANYSAAKAGLIGLTRTLAREMAASGVTVNAVAPGYVDTDLTAGMDEGKRAKSLERVPMGRFGRPEEVARVVAFLASDEAGYITGETLCVDGGLRM